VANLPHKKSAQADRAREIQSKPERKPMSGCSNDGGRAYTVEHVNGLRETVRAWDDQAARLKARQLASAGMCPVRLRVWRAAVLNPQAGTWMWETVVPLGSW
jgi:hypothetical protein